MESGVVAACCKAERGMVGWDRDGMQKIDIRGRGYGSEKIEAKVGRLERT